MNILLSLVLLIASMQSACATSVEKKSTPLAGNTASSAASAGPAVEKEVIAELEMKPSSQKIEVPVNPTIDPTVTPPKATQPEKVSGHSALAGISQAVQSHHDTQAATPAEKALGWLKNGNTRYIKGKLRRDGQSAADRERLTAGQHPQTILLSCSDSRVPPEVVFDQKLGEIFVVRTAGEALDNVALASLEYAVDHLGPQLLLVMAHESCGAIKAAFSTLEGQDAGSVALNALVKDIHPRIASAKGHDPSKNYLSEAKANAAGVAKDLLGRSKIIEEKVKMGGLRIETAIYHLDSGMVEFF